jgi:hypothetical protein
MSCDNGPEGLAQPTIDTGRLGRPLTSSHLFVRGVSACCHHLPREPGWHDMIAPQRVFKRRSQGLFPCARGRPVSRCNSAGLRLRRPILGIYALSSWFCRGIYRQNGPRRKRRASGRCVGQIFCSASGSNKLDHVRNRPVRVFCPRCHAGCHAGSWVFMLLAWTGPVLWIWRVWCASARGTRGHCRIAMHRIL